MAGGIGRDNGYNEAEFMSLIQVSYRSDFNYDHE